VAGTPQSNIWRFPLRTVAATPSVVKDSPVTPAPERPVRTVIPSPVGKPVVSGVSALDMLAKRARRPAAADSDAEADTSGGAQGEAPELHMQAEKDDAGRLTVRSAEQRKAEPESREEAYAAQYDGANSRMADEEKNILRHRDDYAAYQEMSDSLDPGGYER